MAITVLPLLNIGGMSLFKSEGAEFEKILPSSKEIAMVCTKIYFILTADLRLMLLSFWHECF